MVNSNPGNIKIVNLELSNINFYYFEQIQAIFLLANSTQGSNIYFNLSNVIVQNNTCNNNNGFNSLVIASSINLYIFVENLFYISNSFAQGMNQLIYINYLKNSFI